MIIYWLTDGIDGHRRQAEGLFAGLARCGVSLQLHEISVQHGWRDWLSIERYLPKQQLPDLLLGVGHRTHLPLLWLKRQYPQAQSLLLMRPSLPLSWFNLLIMPQHDAPPRSPQIFVTQGALNPFTNQQRHQVGRHLILIGGASKRHGWDQAQLLKQLAQLAQRLPTHAVWLTGSRRTPASLFEDLNFQKITQNMQNLSDVDRLPEQLQLAETVWVTEDSVSMLYEAWTAGCQMGLLQMPRHKQDRVTHALDQLIERQVVLPLADYLAGQALRVPPRLVESDRAAGWLLLQLRQRLNGQ